jgi:hypothetical protein
LLSAARDEETEKNAKAQQNTVEHKKIVILMGHAVV